jgi:hypothetical protein
MSQKKFSIGHYPELGYTFAIGFFKACFNITLLYTSLSPKKLFYEVFQGIFFYVFLISPMVFICPS